MTYIISTIVCLIVYAALNFGLLVAAAQSSAVGSSTGGVRALMWILTIVILAGSALLGGTAVFLGCLTGIAAVTVYFRGGLLFR